MRLEALSTQKGHNAISDAACEAIFIICLTQPTGLLFVSQKATLDEDGRAGSPMDHCETSFLGSPIFSFSAAARDPLNRLGQFFPSPVLQLHGCRNLQTILDQFDGLQALGIAKIGLESVNVGCILDGGIQMYAHENGRVCIVGDFGSFFQRNEDVIVPRHQDPETLFFKLGLQTLRYIERGLFFDQLIGDSASIVPPVPSIDHDQRWLRFP